MPGYDQTGPQGSGPRTGGGFGNCDNANNNTGGGRGGAGGRRGAGQGRCGMRQRRGRQGGGRRSGAASTGRQASGPDPSSDISWLQDRTRQLTAELESVRSRLAEIEDPAPAGDEPAADVPIH